MQINKRSADQTESAVGELYFGADIVYQYMARTTDGDGFDICVVDFEPGGRNKMHTHIHDQILYVVSGRGIVGNAEGETVVEAGDTIVIPAGQPHWHGATPTDRFTHLCIEKHNNEITIVG